MTLIGLRCGFKGLEIKYLQNYRPKISYRYLKSGIEEFHRKFVLVPADKAADNVVAV